MILHATQDLTLDKSTKNTHVYTAAPGQPPIVRTLYVDKYAFSGEPPKHLTLILPPKESP